MKNGLCAIALLLATTIACAGRDGAAPVAGDATRFQRVLARPAYAADGKTVIAEQPFLALPDQVLIAYDVTREQIAKVDPGLVCSGKSTVTSSKIGRVGSIQTTCTPAGFSESFIDLADGSVFESTCKQLGRKPGSATASHCTGWSKVP